MGLHAQIFKWNLGDCSLGGISSRVNAVTIVNVDGPFEPDDEHPAVKIVRREIYGKEYLHAEPVEPGTWAAGGTLICSSDSRFSEASQYPLHLHDRDMAKETR